MANRKKGASSFHQTRAPLFFLAPNLLIFFIFIIIPAVSGLRMSFYEWSILGGHSFTGISNYQALIGDAMFWKTLGNTLRFVLFVVPLLTASALCIALLVSAEDSSNGLFRGFYYLPTMLSFVIVGITWRWILGDEIGVLNYIIKQTGGESVQWLTLPAMATTSLIFISVWAQTGFYMVMFVGGLQAIPESLFDAASIDGASKWQTFTKIKLPMIRPTMLVVVVLATINSFKAFELIFVLTKGGPGTATKFLVQSIYQVAFEEDRMGYASSMAVILMLVIGVLTMLQFKLNKEYSNE
ncbi:carbohydrate ABC transporter permease [Oceanispirochaeta sp.]|jgi:alpha-1,4-digalacturonate transport system permease protein|uniref:carbohydrate ABC transporter permease n=1 Tax=Oceanispirochaeta sp. TaxID=2035350 RepID=UPI00260E2F96|nr:sugar ABC transporter permease [Oceanispirochaeta sp.]MDA3958361.1 sugar ABC transporter permease [Oceanispirochaeta sp.]